MLLLAALLATSPICDAIWHDPARNRDIPVRIRLPEGTAKVPVILFSHGLGGDTAGGTLWGQAWAAHGFAVIHIQHAGSDTAVYRDAKGPEDTKARVRAAATGAQLQARVADVSFVLDELATRKTEGKCNLTRLDTSRVGIAGHSMGAWTAQAIAGQNFFGAPRLVDRRFTAALAFSPSAPNNGTAAEAFAAITIPFMSVTGSLDGNPLAAKAEIRAAAEAQRTGPYTAMPPGQKYLLVFEGGDHMVFSGNSRRTPTSTDLHIQTATKAATTAFWGATLLNGKADASFLKSGSGLKAMLSPADRFDAK
nr:alpha/beta hydrolase-fold protein [Polymorphobacter sp.]